MDDLQIAEKDYSFAQAKLQRANEMASDLERTRAKIEDELDALESERKSLAVAAAKGKSGAKTRTAEILARRDELAKELELFETAEEEIEEQTTAAHQKCSATEVPVIEEKMKIIGARLKSTGTEVDNALKHLALSLSNHYRALRDLEALASNDKAHLAVQNRIIADWVHRASASGMLDCAIANVPGLPFQITKGLSVGPQDFKSLEKAMTELANGNCPK